MEEIIESITKLEYKGSMSINLDSCYAGNWVEQANQLKKDGKLDHINRLGIVAYCAKDKRIQWGMTRHLDRKREKHFENDNDRFMLHLNDYNKKNGSIKKF